MKTIPEGAQLPPGLLDNEEIDPEPRTLVGMTTVKLANTAEQSQLGIPARQPNELQFPQRTDHLVVVLDEDTEVPNYVIPAGTSVFLRFYNVLRARWVASSNQVGHWQFLVETAKQNYWVFETRLGIWSIAETQ